MAPGERLSKFAEQAVVEEGAPRARLADLDVRVEASIPDGPPVGWASRQDAAQTRSQRYDYLIHRFLVVADVSALLVSALITVLLANIVGRPSMSWTWWAAIGITLPAWILIVHAFGSPSGM